MNYEYGPNKKRARVKTRRFDTEEYENSDILLLQQAIENSKRETSRIDTSSIVPEAPTFYPSLEEFSDPLKYISRYFLNKIIQFYFIYPHDKLVYNR